MKRAAFNCSLRSLAGCIAVAGVVAVIAMGEDGLRAASPTEGSLPASVVELRQAARISEVDFSSVGPVPTGVVTRPGRWVQEEIEVPGFDPRNPRTGTERATVTRYVEPEQIEVSSVPITNGPAHPRGVLPTVRYGFGLPTLRAPSAPGTYVAWAASAGVFDHFAGEPFLSQLNLRLRRAALSRSLRREIEDYLIEREALTLELLAQLAASDASGDPTPWRALAARQAQRLSALEGTADELRRKLGRGSWLDGDGFDLLENRRWRIDEAMLARPRQELMSQEVQLARGSAYSAEGFSPAQRRLLLEAAEDFMRPTVKLPRDAPEGPLATLQFSPGRQPRFTAGFLPEQSRVELGAIDPELAQELRAIDELKRALKQELLDVLYFNDRHSEATRRELCSRLAAAQEPRIAELEQRCEAVRPALLRCYTLPPRDPEPELSPELRERIERHRAANRAFQSQLKRDATVVSRIAEPPRVFRLHTSDAALQAEHILGLLAQFEGRRVKELAEIAGGGSSATARDRELGTELRRLLRPVWPCATAPHFTYSCDRNHTTEEQRAKVRSEIAAMWAKRRDLTESLENEAGMLAVELRRDNWPGIEEFLRRARAHWAAVEWASRELSVELGLTAPRESEQDFQKRRAEALADLARQREKQMQALATEEAAIRSELARTLGAGKLGPRSVDEILGDNQRRLRAERDLLDQRVYRTAVLMPGLSPAQRRLLLGVAVINFRRNSAPQSEDNPVAH